MPHPAQGLTRALRGLRRTCIKQLNIPAQATVKVPLLDLTE